MRIRADFSKRECVQTHELDWTPSPLAGVERRMLDRVGAEVARATSVVRYAPGSAFSAHVHGGGEEIFVLEGVFEDEHGAFGPGTYLRNPPTSEHTPGSSPGCVILVKLWQFDPDDRQTVRIDTRTVEPTSQGESLHTTALHEDSRESVRIERWDQGREAALGAPGGTELFVLEGGLQVRDEDDILELTAGAWLRLPVGSAAQATASEQGVRIWIKTGHVSLW